MTDLNIENFSIDKSSWSKVKFGDVVYEPKESVKDPVAEGIEHVVGLEHIDSEDIHLRRSASIEEGTTFTKRFRKGDVLFGRRRAYLKKAARAAFGGVCSGDIIVMRAREELIIPELLPFLINSDKFFDYAITHSAGGLSPRVKFKDLATYTFPLPPKEEQAGLLTLLNSADNWIEKNKALEKQAEDLISAYKKEHFQANHPKFIPLGECGSWRSGGTPSRRRPDYWGGETPWFSPKDMKKEVVTNSIETITDVALSEAAKLIPQNSLLIVVRGLILAHSFPVALTGVKSYFNQDMKALIAKENFDPEYLLAFLQEKRDEVLSIVTTTTHGTKRLATDALFSLRVPDIPRTEQKAFLVNLQLKKDALNNTSEALAYGRKMFKSLKDRVF